MAILQGFHQKGAGRVAMQGGLWYYQIVFLHVSSRDGFLN